MNVHVVSASAGTGKTYRLTGEVARALRDGEARAEGVVAITYTKKAAAELESRIRTDLVASGRGDLAARVRDGYLGTVHSVCERLLREYALEAGHSPYLEPIAEAQRERMFAEALAAVLSGRERRIEPIAWRFGLENWEAGPLKAIVELARENGLDGPALRAAGEASLAALLAYLPPTTIGEEEYRNRLIEEAEEADRALTELDRNGSAAKDRRDAVSELVRALRRPGLPPWAAQLKAIRQKWTRTEQPIVTKLMELVASHLQCARFRADIEELTRELFAVAADALDAYGEIKQAARVVDFQDMLANAASLLSHARVAADLGQKLDLVVVDEFQDTSPMQLAVVSALARTARRSVWVGDRKQAIFGFQGSDPVLMNAAMRHALGEREPEFLSESWRSRPPLVRFTSELFARALGPHGFSDREVRISTPKERPDPPTMANEPVLECWWWEGGEEVNAVANGVERLLAEAPPVRDRDSGTVRPLARRDIAVLSRRNEDCRKLAAALAARGIPSRTELADLATTPEAILLRSALALVADPSDGVAAMDVSYLGGRGAADPDGWLSARLVEVARNRAERARAESSGTPAATLPFSDDPRVSALREVHERSATLAPTEALDAAIAAAGLLELLRTWPDPAQRVANAEAIRGAARAYEDLCRVQRSAGTIAGLVEHLASLAELKDADLQAVPGTEDAVTLSTWHSAKGLEWPVVVLASLGFTRERDVWSPAIERPASFDPASPLAGRWVRYWPWPYGNLSANLELASRVDGGREALAIREDEGRERVRILYVAFTRARDRLVLAAAMKRGSPVLSALAPLCDAAGRPLLAFPFGEAEGPASVRVGKAELTCRVRTLSPAEVEPAAVTPAPRPWYDGAQPQDRLAELVSPSSERLDDEVACRILQVTPLAGRAQLDRVSDMGTLGDAVHAFLAADRWNGDREAVAIRLLAAYGIVGAVAPGSLLQSSDALRSFLDARFPGAAWRREWPVRARISDRGQARLLRGEVDLFLERHDGFVVVDHKSFPGNERERDERVVKYGAQLGLYAFVLGRALGKPLLGAFIHLPIRGEIVELDVGPVVSEWTRRSGTKSELISVASDG